MKRLLALLLVGVAGCANEYLYEPAEHATATANGLPAAQYDLPPAGPRGDVRVTATGVTKIRLASGEVMRVLHLRMIITNNSDDRPWTLDTRGLLVWLPGEGRSAPAFVNSNVPEGLPIVQVPRNDKRTLDLYYPLPAGMQKERRLPGFDLTWQVQTGAGAFAQRTPFERVEIEPAYAYDWAWGYGPYWWYDPFYPTVTFVHPFAFEGPHIGGEVRLAPHR